MQLDILAEFELETLLSNSTEDEVSDCGDGAVDRSTYGPFGVLVIADDSLSELTPIYFRPLNTSDGSLGTYFCADETRFASNCEFQLTSERTMYKWFDAGLLKLPMSRNGCMEAKFQCLTMKPTI